MVSLAEKRQAAGYLQESYPVSERRACRVLQLSRSSRRRRPGSPSQAALVRCIHDLSTRYPRFGYRKIAVLLKQAGWRVGRERVRLMRRQEGLQVIVKQKKKRRVGRSTLALKQATYPHQLWSYDFVHDRTTDGRTLKCLTIEDEFTRQGLAIHAARSITAAMSSGYYRDYSLNMVYRPVLRVTMDRNWSRGHCRTGWLTSRWAPITLTRAVPGRTGPMKVSMRYFGTAV